MKLTASPRCPQCQKTKNRSEQSSFFIDGDVARCALCGWDLENKHFDTVEVPAFLERLLKSMVIRNMMSIDAVDGDSFVASNEPAKSKAVTINFQHRELMVSGVMTWYEVDEARAFKEHECDFEAIQNFVPLVSAMVDEFRADEFLISECPGKEGRALRNAGIRMLRYGHITEGLGAKKVHKAIYVRAYLTWDVNYRRAADGGVEKIPN
jgi:hypothetical protein